VSVEAPMGSSRPAVVGLLFPLRADQGVLAALGAVADVRHIGWVDSAVVRQEKSEGLRRPARIRALERPLTERQRTDLAESEALLALDLPLDVVTLAPRLRFVQGIGAGVGQLIGVLRGSSVRLSSAAGLGSDKIAEFVMARLLGVWADLRTLDRLQQARRWAPGEVVTDGMAGRTVVVVGTGGIGQAFARRAKAFDLRVLGVRRRPDLGAPMGFERVVGPESLHGLLGEADAVVLAAPATERTEGLIGVDELAAMRPGSVLCNVARGSLVDEPALVASLQSGHLGAAILDVVASEPLSRRSPLWRAPRTYLSPHVANAWRPEYGARIGALFAENVVRDREGMELRNQVDLVEGY
jgi:phosphoglycerate dehydrogenase-like enzyme